MRYLLILFMLLPVLCSAQMFIGDEAEEYKGYRVGDVYKDDEGDTGIVVGVYVDGLRYNLELYKERIPQELTYEEEYYKRELK